MEKFFLVCFCLVFFFIGIQCLEEDDIKNSQTLSANERNVVKSKKRVFSFLEVLKFPNDICGGDTRNGTCYSSDECKTKGGTASGTCANGYGVCCVFMMSCGQTSSENNTFLMLSATTNPTPSLCTYILCETNPSVCRIRLDFTTFSISGPQVGTTVVAEQLGATPTTLGGSIGHCVYDMFTLSAPNNRGSPVICGYNSGQHMYIDTSSNGCAKATFDLTAPSVSRFYDIKVTQYNCYDDIAGPPDCLQYFTGNTGTVMSFNFALTNGMVTASTTHLSNQRYNICFRRNLGKCAICFVPTRSPAESGTAVIDQASFGLSVTPLAVGVGNPGTVGLDSSCTTDYLIIPNGVAAGDVLTLSLKNAINTPTRFCGRVLNPVAIKTNPAPTPPSAQTVQASVCTGQRPFRITFNTDDNELTISTRVQIAAIPPSTPAILAIDANGNELSGVPGGIVGFSLDFVQLSC